MKHGLIMSEKSERDCRKLSKYKMIVADILKYTSFPSLFYMEDQNLNMAL